MTCGPSFLLVEDSEADVLLFRRAMSKAGLNAACHVAEDGAQAVSYLSGEPPFSDRTRYPLPSLVLLDLKLPQRSGLEILRWIRRNPGTRGIPVIVLSSSSEAEDIQRAYALGARLYVTKPTGSARLRELVGAIGAYVADPEPGLEKALERFATPPAQKVTGQARP